MKNKVSYYTLVTEILPETNERIIYSTRSGESFIVSKDFYSCFLSDITSIDRNIIQKLINAKILVNEDEDEFETIIRENKNAEDKKIDTLYHVIQPSANCQLGCFYCGQTHTKETINGEILEDIYNRIASKIPQRHFKSIAITWYGGEPLMALNQIKSFTPRLLTLAKENNLTYTSDMITNGLSLKKEVFYYLVEHCSLDSFQITIDGLKEEHDKRRYLKNGGGTFDVILKNILDIVGDDRYNELNKAISIRINVDNKNYQSVISFIQLLASYKLQDKLSVNIAPIHDWGEVNAAKDSLSKQDFADLEIDCYIEMIKHGFEIDIIPKRKEIVCMVVDKYSEVYDAYGNISTCWEVPYTDIYKESSYVIGNIKDKNFSLLDKNIPMRNWTNEIKEDNSKWCHSCKFLPVCGGSCPKHWYDNQIPCPPFKKNMEDRLVLNYLSNNLELKKIIS
ncbi:MAG: SPASM domain-containing protein [Chitinophagales bacterium]|nr:SPASM domain-containing protein [Chitinophagales bacterium]